MTKADTHEPGWWDSGPLLPAVMVEDEGPEFTGLLDAAGNRIYRTKNPIGFGRDKEWRE